MGIRERLSVLLSEAPAGAEAIERVAQPPARLATDITRSELPVVIAGPEVLARDDVLDAATNRGRTLRIGHPGGLGGSVRPDAAAGPGVAIEMLTLRTVLERDAALTEEVPQ